MLNRAEEVRLLADYTGGSVEPADAHELLSQADTFVNAVRGYLDDGSRGAGGTTADDA